MNMQFSNEQILKKAVKKAYENGWTAYRKGLADTVHYYNIDYDRPDVYSVIFSHVFAKAFWKDDKTRFKIWGTGLFEEQWVDAWEYYLMQMVRQEEPLKYLEKFL